jgi:hypothetical protein
LIFVDSEDGQDVSIVSEYIVCFYVIVISYRHRRLKIGLWEKVVLTVVILTTSDKTSGL